MTQINAETLAQDANTDWVHTFMMDWAHPTNGFHFDLISGYEFSIPKLFVCLFILWIAYVIWYKRKHKKTLYEVFTDPRQTALYAGNHMHNGLFDEVRINPATGLPMRGGVDTAGNPIGSSSSRDYEHRSSHDPYHH